METDSGAPRSNADKKRLYVRIMAIAIVAIAIACAGVWFAYRGNDHNATPTELVNAKHTVPYTLYYPSKLPKDVSFVTGSLKQTKDVTIYSLTINSKKAFVSIEPKPKGVIFDDFYTRVLANKADVFSRLGKAAIGTANGQMIGSLVSRDAWVLINAPLTTDNQTMQSLLSSLAPVK